MRIIVLGSNGMVGRELVGYLSSKFDVIGVQRSDFDAWYDNISKIPSGDYIINCIGITKQKIRHGTDFYKASMINSCFPWKLSEYCFINGSRLIHVSTDCVFSGKKGNYTEEDEPDFEEFDVYSKTKCWGEPGNAMVIRSSFVGHENPLKQGLSLLSWSKRQQDKTVQGFTNHIWNGLTTRQFGKTIETIIKNDYWVPDTRHIFSPDFISKYEMLTAFNSQLNLNLNIIPVEHEQRVDRSLGTIHNLNDLLLIPSFFEMVKEL